LSGLGIYLNLVEDSFESLVEVLDFLLGAHGGRKKIGPSGPCSCFFGEIIKEIFLELHQTVNGTNWEIQIPC
jgi:hypothetical protein